MPTIGRIVHVVLKAGFDVVHRPATIVRTWPRADGSPEPYVNVQCFTDGSNDRMEPVMHLTSVRYDPKAKEPHTWHYPGADCRQ